jgi:8-hydroxy-5-deazaflavin:NADPH oxidoreductase
MLFRKSNRDRRWVVKVGFIGAGTVTGTFGRHLITAGHTIVVSNSRGPATLADFVADLGPGAIAGRKQQERQAVECDVVILATRWVSVADALKGIDWRGRILIDATNAHVDSVPDISLAGVTRSRAALKGRTSSEIVAEMAVGARLVKSISNMPMAWIQDFSPNKPRTVIFTSGDDTEAKQLV